VLESTPAPADAPSGKPPEPPKGRSPVGPIARAVCFLPTGSGRRAAFTGVVLAALAAGLVGGAFIFRSAGYRRGYHLGYESVGYYEGAAIADSMKAAAGNAVLESAGMLPDRSRQGSWQVARFSLTRARELCSYGAAPDADTLVVATFASQESAEVGKSFYSGSDGRIHYVSR
jgi:hypothetical protein